MEGTVRVADWIRMRAEHLPDKNCFVTPAQRFTFGAVNTRVNRLASAMRSHGVRQGDRVAILATDSHRFLETHLASLKLGAVHVPLNYRLRAPEAATLLRAAEPSMLFVSERYTDVAAALRGDVPSLDVVVDYDGDADGADVGYEAMVDAGDDVEPDVRIGDDDLVVLAFSSGTTGLPKGVTHSHRIYKAFVYQTLIERRLPAESFHYAAAPMFHAAGIQFVLIGLLRGFPSLLLPEFEPATVLQWMQGGELNGCFLVPTMISTLLQHPDVHAGDYERIHSIVYGGAPMSPALLRQALDTFGCDFINMFGAGTEIGLQTILTPEDHRRALRGDEHLLGSIGKPAFNVDLRLCDDELRDVAQGEVGEIVTRTDIVMGGYLGLPEKTAHVSVDGWFRAGDMAWMDDEGYLYLTGRKDDMIIRGGENVYPLEIETILAALPGIVEVAVVGVPDEHWGQTVRAHVVVATGSDVDAALLREHCRVQLASYKVPSEFRLEAELPKNPSGKILKRELSTRP